MWVDYPWAWVARSFTNPTPRVLIQKVEQHTTILKALGTALAIILGFGNKKRGGDLMWQLLTDFS